MVKAFAGDLPEVFGAQAFLWQRRADAGSLPESLAEALVFDPLTDPEASGATLRAAVAPRRIRTVLCLAGVIRGDEAALAVNSDLAIAALKIAKVCGAGRVLLSSSAAVYGAQAGLLHEDVLLTPAAPYGAAKAQMEADALAWRDAHAPQIEICALRIGNVAGADALLGRPEARSGAAVALAPPRAPLTLDVFADGHGPWRSYIGPRAFAHAIMRAVAAPALPPALNIALQGMVPMDALLQAAGHSFTPRAAPAGAIATVELECSRAAALGLVPFARAQAREICDELSAYRKIALEME